MFSTITTEPSTTMPKSSAPSERRLAGMWRRSSRMEAKSSEKGMVSATMNGAADVAEKQKQDDHHQGHALAQIVQDGFGGGMDQVAAVKVRDDLHARRQHVTIHQIHLFVQGGQGLFRIRSFAQQHDALHHVIVVHHLAVLAVHDFAQFSQADFGVLASPRRCRARAPACRFAPSRPWRPRRPPFASGPRRER